MLVDSFRWLGRLLACLPPEAAHRLTIRSLALGLAPAIPGADDPILGTRVWGREFPNPIGLAAGFDKDAEVYAAMLGLGFGFVETGSITPRPQPGNPKPRVFRLPRSEAVINRLGFNSRGMAAAARNLRPRSARRQGIVGVNLGKNRDSVDAAADYAAGAGALAGFADYLVINVSSPNTPGLRALQSTDSLFDLIGRVRRALDQAMPRAAPPLLLKIAPDLTSDDRRDIAAVALSLRLDGMIVGNTTITRPPGLEGAHAAEPGGLSGRPLFALSTEILRDMYRRTEGRIPLIGVGGVADGRDAYGKIRAGASLVQLYTALIYEGPRLVQRLKRELAACLRADGLTSVGAAVGLDHRQMPATP